MVLLACSNHEKHYIPHQKQMALNSKNMGNLVVYSSSKANSRPDLQNHPDIYLLTILTISLNKQQKRS
jgi:hypothetical protein